VGQDAFGEFLRNTLEDAGVDTAWLGCSADARTTLAFVASRSDGQKDICFYRHPGADTLLRPEDVSPHYLGSASLFHFGSVSLSRSPARGATMHAAQLARSSGLLVSYDPNWRPTLWDDEAEGRRRIWKAMALADIVHCAEEEWEFITGTADLGDGCRKILDAGPRLVTVTLGERGCYYHGGESCGRVPGFDVEVVDPLGAGDAFVAGVLSQVLRAPHGSALDESEIRDVVTYANAAGALTCTGRGVIPSLPTSDQVAEFLAVRAR
jgi:fructokinase